MPGEGEPAHRGERVGLVLHPAATQAWRQGGEVWEPASPRIFAAKLKVNSKRNCKHLHLVSVYAPTFRASNEEKEIFFTDLERVLDRIPDRDLLVVMGGLECEGRIK